MCNRTAALQQSILFCYHYISFFYHENNQVAVAIVDIPSLIPHSGDKMLAMQRKPIKGLRRQRLDRGSWYRSGCQR